MSGNTTTQTPELRFDVEEIQAYAELEITGKAWALISRTLNDGELAAITLARQAISNARTLDSVKESFVKNYDETTAVEFLASVPEFVERFVGLSKSAVVKVQGRGKETKERFGNVSYNPDGDARVSMLAIPAGEWTLKVLVERPSSAEPTTKNTDK